MQPAVQEFVELGRLPDGADASVEDLRRREEILGRIRTPLIDDEARALTACFGTDDCFGFAWNLLHAIETSPSWPLADILGNADNEWIGRLRERSSI